MKIDIKRLLILTAFIPLVVGFQNCSKSLSIDESQLTDNLDEGGGSGDPDGDSGTNPTPTPNPGTNPTPTPIPAGSNTTALVKQGKVLDVGGAGAFDEKSIESPNGFYDNATNQWVMYYTGYSTADKASIGVATAPTLEGPWTKRGVALAGSGSGGDASGATGPVIFVENGVYYLYYIALAQDGYEAANSGIFLATAGSAFGPFTRQGAKIEASGSHAWRTNTVWHINIVKNGATYYGFFNAGNNTTESIGYATATAPGGPWTVQDANSPLMLPGTGTDWDAGLIGDPYVYKLGNTWFMAYYGVNSSFAQGSDGYATTTEADFPHNWVKASAPVLTPGAQYTYDGKSAYKPWIINIGTKHYHFYAAISDSGVPSIGYAKADIY